MVKPLTWKTFKFFLFNLYILAKPLFFLGYIFTF